MMHETIAGIRSGTRDLDMEVLCSLPCESRRVMVADRQYRTTGARLVTLGEDLGVNTATIRGAVQNLKASKLYGVHTGDLSPCKTPNGKFLVGGHCAFIQSAHWPKTEQICQEYWDEHEKVEIMPGRP